MHGTTHSAAALPGMSQRWLNWIERTGNRLPDPVTLFVIFCGLVLAASALGAAAGWSVVNPANGKTIEVVSLLNGEGLRRILTGLTSNFANFPPLFTVLVAMIGVGVAEASGLLSALLRRLALATPRVLLTPTVVFLSVMSSLASDVGYVVLVPLAAMLFAAAGRHPLAGLAASFAGVSGASRPTCCWARWTRCWPGPRRWLRAWSTPRTRSTPRPTTTSWRPPRGWSRCSRGG